MPSQKTCDFVCEWQSLIGKSINAKTDPSDKILELPPKIDLINKRSDYNSEDKDRTRRIVFVVRYLIHESMDSKGGWERTRGLDSSGEYFQLFIPFSIDYGTISTIQFYPRTAYLLSDIPEWSFGNSISDKETRLWFMDISRTQLNDCLDYRPPRQCSAREVACERPIVRMLCSGNATVSWWINEQARNDINGFPLPRRLVMIVLPPPRLQPKIHVNRPPGDSLFVSYYA